MQIYNQQNTKLKYVCLVSMIIISAQLMFSCVLLPSNLGVSDTSHTITSPDENLVLSLKWDEHYSPQYSISFDNDTVVSFSDVDLRHPDSESKHILKYQSEASVDEVSELPWGQFSQIKHQYKSISFSLFEADSGQQLSTLEFRIYNNAVAFRHVFDRREQAEHASGRYLNERSVFNFTNDYASYSRFVEQEPKYLPSLAENQKEHLAIPAAFVKSGQVSVAIQEASLTESAQMKLETIKGTHGVRVLSKTIGGLHKPNSTAWRVIQFSQNLGDLLTSQVLVSLSEQSEIEDTSWIRPGKSFWDWRVRGARYGEHIYRLDNESLTRMIDFASKHNMQYVMVDANWYGPEHLPQSDPFTAIEGLDIKRLIAEANNKGIGFILYLNDVVSLNYELDKLFETWASWGAAGVKYGFMKAQGREKVKKTLNIVELAAKHKLLINFHDRPIAPSGLRRKWPNWITREYVHGQTDGARSFDPSGFIQMAHVNALSGPLDMSNGFFTLDGLVESRDYVRTEVNSTLASELARVLIIFSGLIILPDAPEAYLQKPDLFEFLQRMPSTWDESKILSSNIDNHLVTARRSGEEWFIGAVINEDGGNLEIELPFLDSNKIYQAKIFADADDTHYIHKREAYKIESRQLEKGDTLTMKLAPGGGQAVWIKPLTSGMQ